MRLRVDPHSLTLLVLLNSARVYSAQFNTTYDDIAPSFSYKGHWDTFTPTSPCTNCEPAVDPSQVQGGTWRLGFFFPALVSANAATNGTFVFAGSAVYLYGIAAAAIEPTLQFTLDGVPQPSKAYRYTGSEPLVYHSLFFAATGLSTGTTHTLFFGCVTAPGGAATEQIMVDYAVVTGEDDGSGAGGASQQQNGGSGTGKAASGTSDAQQSSHSTSSSASTTSSSSTNSASLTSPQAANIPSSSTAVFISSSSDKTPIIVGVVLGILLLLACLVLLLLCLRRRRRDAGESEPANRDPFLLPLTMRASPVSSEKGVRHFNAGTSDWASRSNADSDSRRASLSVAAESGSTFGYPTEVDSLPPATTRTTTTNTSSPLTIDASSRIIELERLVDARLAVLEQHVMVPPPY